VSEVTIAHNGPDGAIRFFSTIARDMRERKAYEARLQRYANYDSLTNLPNRTLLGDRTLQAIAHARRGGRPAALLVLNLDRFKLVNESYGHGAGDALLKMVADRLRGVVREGDTVARLGADTFAVLATDLARPDDVLAVVRKIQEAMRPSFGLEKRDLHMTVSLGASTYPRDGEEFDILVRNAEAAMHRVKAAGRNGFNMVANALTTQVRAIADVSTAVTEGDLTPHHLLAMEYAVGGIAEQDHLHVGGGQGGVAQGHCGGLLRQRPQIRVGMAAEGCRARACRGAAEARAQCGRDRKRRSHAGDCGDARWKIGWCRRSAECWKSSWQLI